MSMNDLVRYYEIDNEEALRARLYRFRLKHRLSPEAFQEVANRGVRQAQFLYNVAMVGPIVKDLKKTDASAKRATRRR